MLMPERTVPGGGNSMHKGLEVRVYFTMFGE